LLYLFHSIHPGGEISSDNLKEFTQKARFYNNNFLKPDADRIRITDSPEFAKDLLPYLESTEPLSSCYYCLGSLGKLFAHEQKSVQHGDRINRCQQKN
jgi:hypothetical protein